MNADRPNPRQVALSALRLIYKGAFADVAVDRVLSSHPLPERDRRLCTELIYGCIRRQRTLDTIIDQWAKKPALQQPLDLRLLLHLGLYQLFYLSQVPPSAAVDTTVELAKQNGLAGLAGVVNGLLRRGTREEPLGTMTGSPTTQLGIMQSYPDWIIQVWLDQFGYDDTEALCEWLNQPPHLDIRINTLKATRLETERAIEAFGGIQVTQIPELPQGLRLSHGAIPSLPGFHQGHWIVQDASAQLVSYLLDPRPGETIADACSAPGGKTMHIAELMQDTGTVYAIDRTESRLKKLKQNADRLGLTSIQMRTGDARQLSDLKGTCDRVLVDAPCSGLGTLNRHADARWRQTPENVMELAVLQSEILAAASTWVKPRGVLVYATCTLHPQENEQVIEQFLQTHPGWRIEAPRADSVAANFADRDRGWIKVLPHQHQMDGFFMVRLVN